MAFSAEDSLEKAMFLVQFVKVLEFEVYCRDLMDLYNINDLVDLNGQVVVGTVLRKYKGYITRKIDKWGF